MRVRAFHAVIAWMMFGSVLVSAVCSAVVASRAAAQTAPPDVVRLRDGGMLRGTIAELRPGEHVTIVLLTGETRRVPAAEFTFAGPAEEAPRAGGVIPPAPTVDSAPPPMDGSPSPSDRAPPPNDGAPTPARATTAEDTRGVGQARVRFRGTDGARLVVDAAAAPDAAAVSPAPQFRRVCTTPCELVMPVGAYQFALTRTGLPRLTVAHLVPLEDRDRVELDYETRNGTRAGGLVFMAIGGAAGIGIALAPLAVDERSRDKFIVPAIVCGAVIAGLGAVVGLLMHGADDTAHARVRHDDDDDDDEDDDDEEDD